MRLFMAADFGGSEHGQFDPRSGIGDELGVFDALKATFGVAVCTGLVAVGVALVAG